MQDSTSIGTENYVRVILPQVTRLLKGKAEVDRLWVLYKKQFSRDFAVQLVNKPVNNLIDVYHKDLFSADYKLSDFGIDFIIRGCFPSFLKHLKRHPDTSPQLRAALALQELQAACRCTPSGYQ